MADEFKVQRRVLHQVGDRQAWSEWGDSKLKPREDVSTARDQAMRAQALTSGRTYRVVDAKGRVVWPA